MELKGDMNLHISDASLARVKLALAEPPMNFGPELQFKQHPNVGKFAANRERVIALKDPSRSFPVGQALAVLKWRYSGKDETFVPLSSMSLLVLIMMMDTDFHLSFLRRLVLTPFVINY